MLARRGSPRNATHHLVDQTAEPFGPDRPAAHPPTARLQLRIKRLLDIAVALALILVTAPLMIGIAIAVRFGSRGPALYGYEAVGKDRHTFHMYKFRTMVVNANDLRSQFWDRNEMRGGPVFKIKDDPRITPIGRWLRKFSLDELPELFSVLKGDMSLVGPRQPAVYEVGAYEPWHWEKVKVTPGLTSLWVIRGKSSDFDEWVRQDVEYINRWSLWLDISILLKTIPILLRGQNH